MIGLERGVLRLVPYCEEWSELYTQEAQRIRKAIGPYIRDIQHVGSTAVPGMLAKPIIDIAVAVDCLNEAEVCIRPLEDIGYEYRWKSETPKSHYLVKGSPSEYHLRIYQIGSEDWNAHVRFRDRLRQNRELARQYAELKRRLYAECQGDRDAYQEGKSSFVERVSSEHWAEQPAEPDS